MPSENRYLAVIRQLIEGQPLTHQAALAMAEVPLSAELVAAASTLRDKGFGSVVTYSRKVFIPLTQLCRDVCHYCTFAKTPGKLESPFLALEEVLAIARQGAKLGCKEALFTLGEKPEHRYAVARKALADMGFDSTLDYVRYIADKVLKETGLLPHINAGNMTVDEIRSLRPVAASMGIMLESASDRLCEKGMPHYGSPDKLPARRLATIELAGQEGVPFTSGILIGIGETRRERIQSLLALRDSHERHGHLQEVIIQNFRAKPGTRMAQAPEPDLEDLVWTLAVARLILGAEMSIQVPPNLSPGVLPRLVDAGINDWGGVSPLTPDHVNPEAPWPHLFELARETAAAGKYLEQRLTIYPAYCRRPERWLAQELRPRVLRLRDGEGFARADDWRAGEESSPPPALKVAVGQYAQPPGNVSPDVKSISRDAIAGKPLSAQAVARLFRARGDDFTYICQAANELRRQVNGDTVTYVVNRNINYTNICYFNCRFCAFSKGKTHAALRGKPYDLSLEEIGRRVSEAWHRGATEVCMQGGIHPAYDGDTYLAITRQVKAVEPAIHIHAFSPLEVLQGAETLGVSVRAYLLRLKAAGLTTLPGTAAEVLDDDVRQILCPDKLNSEQWLDVVRTAHELGLKTTATIMYGHVDTYESWGRHLLKLRELQVQTGGITEFVPLPFVAEEAPIYRKGLARRGPSFREAVLMHAVARLVFHGLIDNIQVSWVKMGPEGAAACLDAGANDLGGTLMNESITRAAGAKHGQEMPPEKMDALIEGCGRHPGQRTTLYQPVAEARAKSAYCAPPLQPIQLTTVA